MQGDLGWGSKWGCKGIPKGHAELKNIVMIATMAMMTTAAATMMMMTLQGDHNGTYRIYIYTCMGS